jgi:hypothetical protein
MVLAEREETDTLKRKKGEGTSRSVWKRPEGKKSPKIDLKENR